LGGRRAASGVARECGAAAVKTPTGPPPLSETEERFCHEYLKDLNGTRAYLRVCPEVKPTSAAELASRLLRKIKVKERIAELQAELHRALDARNLIGAQWIEDKLVENVERAMQAKPVLDREGNETGEYVYQGQVANRALELLGKQRGMFGDKLELAVTPEQAKARVFEIFTAAAKQRQGAM
jgi:phage terminase small subunit